MAAETMPEGTRADDPRWEPTDERNRLAVIDCPAHEVDWRAEALRLRPVVAAAEAWRACDVSEYNLTERLTAAIDTYRLARGKAGT